MAPRGTIGACGRNNVDFRPWAFDPFENHVPGRSVARLAHQHGLKEGMPGSGCLQQQANKRGKLTTVRTAERLLVLSLLSTPRGTQDKFACAGATTPAGQSWLPCVRTRRGVPPWVRNLLRTPQTALRDIRRVVLFDRPPPPPYCPVPRSLVSHLLRPWAALIAVLSERMQARLNSMTVSVARPGRADKRACK